MTRYHSDPKIDAAIKTAHARHPYYASALAQVRIVADPSVPTMATSKDWVTHYNPATVKGWTVDETAAVLIHELEHLLKRHSDRCGTRDAGRWNIAADAEINQRLEGLPEGGVYPETLGMPRGLTAEVYFGATTPPPPQLQSGDGSGDGQPGDGTSAPGDGEPSKCGSAAGGPVQPHEANDARNPGRGAADNGAEARTEAATAILGGVGIGKGDSPELREWAEAEVGIDRAAWYSALASAVGYTMAPYGAPTRWQWPGRRDIADMGGAMLPRWTGERPACAVVIDTSGSVGPFDLEMGIAAGHFVGRMADVTYYTCQETARNIGPTLPERLVGGGGTDMRAGIRLAIAEGARAVVVITDCQTPWPSEPSSVPVIIGANPSACIGGSVDYVPDWMIVLPVVSPTE